MMKKMGLLNRILLLLMVLLAAYQVVVCGNAENALATWAYTIGFGVLVIAGLLLIILGYEPLEKPIVVIASSMIPLSLSMGLVTNFLPRWTTAYLIFVILGFLLIVVSRYSSNHRAAVIPLAIVHAGSGLVIILLPLSLSLRGVTPPAIVWVSIGGALIGIGGLLLMFLKSGKPLLSQDKILTALPGMLLLMTVAFSIGFAAIL